MRLLVIYNKLAGRWKYIQASQVVEKALSATTHEVNWHGVETDGSFEKKDLGNYDRVICIGGDGTIKEVVNWIVKNNSETPLAIIPNGTGNVVAQCLNIPLNPKKALDLALTDQIEVVDVGMINNREYFLMSAGIGFDAKVIKNTSKRLKRLFGFLAYVLGFLKSFFNIKPDTYFVRMNNVTKTYKAQSIFVSNFFKLFKFINNPEAKMNDGYLNVAILQSFSLKDLGIVFLKLATGNYAKDWRYEFHKTKQIYIHPIRSKAPQQIDGELANFPYLDIEIVPKALRIIAPKLS